MSKLTSREERIQQLKDCGQDIINKAEEIVGMYEYPIDIKVIIDVACGQPPIIKAERSFVSKEFIERMNKM